MKRSKILMVAMLIGGLALMSETEANILTFDDVGTGALADGYGGLNWDNVTVLNATTYSFASGYQNGLISGDNVALSAYGYDISVDQASNFDFTSVYLTAAWNDGLQLQVTGLDNGAVLYQDNLVLDTSGPFHFIADYMGIDQLTMVVTSPGTDNPAYSGTGTHIVLDDFTVEVVPEPATMGLMGVFAGGIWFVRRFFPKV